MMETWKRLTPHQLRWIAVGIGVMFAVLALLSNFLELLNSGGLAYAMDQAELELFGYSTPCRDTVGRICLHSIQTHYLIDLPLKFLAAFAIVGAALLLYVASTRQRSVVD